MTAAISPSFPRPADAPVGVFDSGVGGLSVLRHIRDQLPHEHLIYCADSAFAPYGDKSEQMVAERSQAVASYLVGRGIKALVVACNTATVAAIKAIRAAYPDLPVVGVEPGLKPGAAASRNGKVGVLATERTLSGEKFLLLRDQIGAASHAQFLLQACVGLVDLIEQGQFDTPAIAAMLDRYVGPLIAQGADTLVLGCTHYPFVQDAIAQAVRRHTSDTVTLVDTGDAVARQLARLLDAGHLLRASSATPATLHGYTSADAPALAAAFASLLKLTPPVELVKI